MPGVDGSGITNTEYPAVRRVMGPQRDRLDDAELEDLIVERFPGADPLDVEDFMHDLQRLGKQVAPLANRALPGALQGADRKSTRLNSSHVRTSYAAFCLKKTQPQH